MVIELKEDRLQCRMKPEVMGWMRKAAAKKRMTVSRFARAIIEEKFEGRHAK